MGCSGFQHCGFNSHCYGSSASIHLLWGGLLLLLLLGELLLLLLTRLLLQSLLLHMQV